MSSVVIIFFMVLTSEAPSSLEVTLPVVDSSVSTAGGSSLVIGIVKVVLSFTITVCFSASLVMGLLNLYFYVVCGASGRRRGAFGRCFVLCIYCDLRSYVKVKIRVNSWTDRSVGTGRQ